MSSVIKPQSRYVDVQLFFTAYFIVLKSKKKN